MREIDKDAKYLPFKQFEYFTQVSEAVNQLFNKLASLCFCGCVCFAITLENPIPAVFGVVALFWLRSIGNYMFATLWPYREKYEETDAYLDRDHVRDYWNNC